LYTGFDGRVGFLWRMFFGTQQFVLLAAFCRRRVQIQINSLRLKLSKMAVGWLSF